MNNRLTQYFAELDQRARSPAHMPACPPAPGESPGNFLDASSLPEPDEREVFRSPALRRRDRTSENDLERPASPALWLMVAGCILVAGGFFVAGSLGKALVGVGTAGMVAGGFVAITESEDRNNARAVQRRRDDGLEGDL